MKMFYPLVLSLFLSSSLPVSSLTLFGTVIPCMSKEEFRPLWAARNETIKRWGIAANGAIVVFSENTETGDWTQFMLHASGDICVLANGDSMNEDTKIIIDLLFPPS